MGIKDDLIVLKGEMNEYYEGIEAQQKEFDEKETEFLSDFEDCCNAVNATLGELFEPINQMYKFLVFFEVVDERVTPFDRAYEKTYVVKKSINRLNDHTQDYETHQKKTGKGALGAAGVGLLVAGPIGALTFAGAKMFKNSSSNKKMAEEEYSERTKVFDEDQAKNEVLIKEHKEYISYLKDAVEIAKLYEGTLMGIKAIVNESILPELKTIRAFLCASTIKNCILSGEDPNKATVESITEHEGSDYYVFVRNTSDYYNLITPFFTKHLMTNILSDKKITTTERLDFKKQIKEIKDFAPKLELHK